MHNERPVARLFHDAAWKISGLRTCFLLLLGSLMFCAAATAAPAKGDKAAQVKQADPSQFVGSDTCATCHDETAKKFAENPHTKIAEMHGKSGVTCEGCHGPGRAHVDGGGDVSKIFNPAKATAKEVDATCLTCHAAAHPNFERSPHAKAGIGCTSCHSVHQSQEKAALLKASQPALCFQCHNDVKPQFEMPFHHKVNEGLVKCSDCHDAHGTFGKSNLRSTADQNAVCTKCHTETRGPFVFEHAAVKAEGCVGCHTPHGSQNARLLNMPNINGLCNQCHSPVANATVHGLDAGSSSQPPCIGCHTMIHGSNASQAFIR
jgi:DmsE family decaheme c-type cytochrome